MVAVAAAEAEAASAATEMANAMRLRHTFNSPEDIKGRFLSILVDDKGRLKKRYERKDANANA